MSDCLGYKCGRHAYHLGCRGPLCHSIEAAYRQLSQTSRQRIRPEHGNLNWIRNAACAGLSPDLFFQEDHARNREAIAICHSCTVRTECLEYAIDGHIPHGIFGGRSERERRQIARDRKQAEAGAA